jgi:DHA2 family multidrug resistance protein
VLWELYGTRNPVVELRVLKYRAISIGSALSVALGFSLFGGVLLVPQFVQGILGFTATMSGELFLVQAGTSGILTFVAVGIIASGKVQARYQVAIGFIFLGIGNWLLAHIESTGADFGNFVFPLVCLGIGMSQLFVPLTVATIGAVPDADVPGASAFTNLARQLGGSVATALLVTVNERSATAHYADLASAITMANPNVAAFVAQHGGNAASTLFSYVQEQASVLGYIDAALVTAIVSVALAPLAFFMGRNRAGMPQGAG